MELEGESLHGSRAEGDGSSKASQRSWIDLRDRYKYCLLCKQHATEEHLLSDKHKVREGESEYWLALVMLYKTKVEVSSLVLERMKE